MRWNLLVAGDQEHITELLLLQVILHFAEGLLRVVCGLEILVRAIGAHPKRAAGHGQPARDRGSDEHSVRNALEVLIMVGFVQKAAQKFFKLKDPTILVLPCLLPAFSLWYLEVFIHKPARKLYFTRLVWSRWC